MFSRLGERLEQRREGRGGSVGDGMADDKLGTTDEPSRQHSSAFGFGFQAVWHSVSSNRKKKVTTVRN